MDRFSPSTIFTDRSLQMLCAQILWWGIGLTLAYDIAETLFHWPHWLAMSLYGSLMIVSAWLGIRAMTLIGIALIPSLIACLYFLLFDALPGSSLFSLWTQLLKAKAFEYLGWFLLVLGSFISGQLLLSNSPCRQKTLLSILGMLSLALGAFMMIHFAISQMHAHGQSNMMLVIVQQGSYFMWLIGVSAKNPRTKKEALRRRSIFVFPRLPVKPIVLVGGTAMVVGYDYFVLHLASGGWVYLTMILPPVAMMLTRKWAGPLLERDPPY